MTAMNILITAGPTREPIDDVRFISNRSSGRMGIAIAAAGADAGHDVTLLMGTGPRDAELPDNVTKVRFESSADLESLLTKHFPLCDVLIMAAAVADYRPTSFTQGKLPSDKGAEMVLHLSPTPDLVAACAAKKRSDQKVIAFALEEASQLQTRAVAKMKRKNVDAIVANPLETMNAADVNATLFYANGHENTPGVMSKQAFAAWLVRVLD